MVDLIENSESALSVREKLNLLITRMNASVGDIVFAPSGSKGVVDGYLAVVGGNKLVNGAIDYPIVSSMCPEFVDGVDIVFPANVDGMFLRDVGGSVSSEGSFQQDELKSHVHSAYGWYNVASGSSRQVLGRNGGHIANVRHTGGVETRPKTALISYI